MADDVLVTAGSGTTIATQDRSSRHFQQVIDQGTDSVAAAQTSISSTSATIVAARANRKRVIIVNRQTVPVFIELTTATTSDFRLDPGDSVTLYCAGLIAGITTNAYTAVGDAKVHSIEEYD